MSVSSGQILAENVKIPDEWIDNEEKDQYFNTIKQSKQDNVADIETLRRKNNSVLQMKKKTLS